MKVIEQPLPIFRLQTLELRSRTVGAGPQGWAKVALMTHEGITIGDTAFSAWSNETFDLLKKLCDSIENDLENALKQGEHKQWGNSSNKKEGISFNEQNWEFE